MIEVTYAVPSKFRRKKYISHNGSKIYVSIKTKSIKMCKILSKKDIYILKIVDKSEGIEYNLDINKDNVEKVDEVYYQMIILRNNRWLKRHSLKWNYYLNSLDQFDDVLNEVV